MWEYSEEVKDHFLHPRNIGVLENADAIGDEGSLTCGDALKLMFNVDVNGRISEVKFQTFGCASAIASASILTEMIHGMTIAEANKITNQQIIDELGGLPKAKIHCSVMGREALQAAIAYYHNGGKPVEKPVPTSRIVCNCYGVTEETIEQAIRTGHLTTAEEVATACEAGGACGSCIGDIEEILERLKSGTIKREETSTMSNIEKIEKIKQVIETTIRPALQSDGGDIKLVDVDGDVVKVQLQGACSGCPMAAITLSNFVEQQLKDNVSADIVLKAV